MQSFDEVSPDGTVTLRGEASRPTLKSDAERAVREIEGVERVDKEYHFNNPEYAREAAEHFNPEHPTSLLYEKNGDGYKLIGVMYTDRMLASIATKPAITSTSRPRGCKCGSRASLRSSLIAAPRCSAG